MREVTRFFRENPQVLILVLICLILGLGTFLAVVFGILSAGNTMTTGQPNGVLSLPRLLVVWMGG